MLFVYVISPFHWVFWSICVGWWKKLDLSIWRIISFELSSQDPSYDTSPFPWNWSDYWSWGTTVSHRPPGDLGQQMFTALSWCTSLWPYSIHWYMRACLVWHLEWPPPSHPLPYLVTSKRERIFFLQEDIGWQNSYFIIFISIIFFLI